MTILWPFNVLANESMNWHWGEEPIYGQGKAAPPDGKLWGIAAYKDDVQITFRLETKSDMSKGGWVGDIRSKERFYVKTRLINQDGHQVYFKLTGARAVGPDAEYGRWKEGPTTASVQAMAFDFNWEQAQKLKGMKSLVINYSSYDNTDESVDIVIPLDDYAEQLSEMEQAIRSTPGASQYLLTDSEVRSMPIEKLPVLIGAPLIKELDQASKFLGQSKNDLMKLSFSEVESLIADQKKNERAAARQVKKAEHQKVYDQQPDWQDLNVCPKPDVKYCKNIGRQGYETDNWFNTDYDYGEVTGVVWRSKGSIIHIYGGNVDYGIEPKIVRAKSGGYYYVLKKEDNYPEIRSVETMKLR